MSAGLTTTAVFIALGVALGLLLAPIPNLEGISAVSFFAGYIVGWGRGGVVGGVAVTLLSLLNPLGAAPPPVLAAQVLGMTSIGCSGHLWRWVVARWGRPELAAIGFGVFLTLWYDLLTNYGVAVSVGRWNDPLPVMMPGVPLSIVHTISNGMIFGGVGALLIRKQLSRKGFGR
jgi:hypothetical protein